MTQEQLELAVDSYAYAITSKTFYAERLVFIRDLVETVRAAQQNGAREALDEAIITLSHARLFVTSRAKMHPDGVKLYDELIDRLQRLEQAKT